MHLMPFLRTALTAVLVGGRRYYLWLATLALIIGFGGFAYAIQLREGLIVTGMNDHVSWGLYISNFTFLVGLAAAAMLLVLPAYVLKDVDFSRAVLMAEAVAVAALVMCLLFVVVDVGNPLGGWHLMPIIGSLNWPSSLLAWDVIVLHGYLALNLAIPFYILYTRYSGRTPDKRRYLPWMYVAVIWAISIHLVTAFLLAGLPARPFWNTALLGPRFLASAFTAGPAFVILLLYFIRSQTSYEVSTGAFTKLALITTVAAQINLLMLGSELFYKFYSPTHHGINAKYLFLGLEGHNALVPWIWTAIALNVLATVALTIHPLRRDPRTLMAACAVLFVAIWVEKGIGLVIPGFVPSPLGEIVEYQPTWVELAVTAGIWGIGLLVLTALVRVALPIELGLVRSPHIRQTAPPQIVRQRLARPVIAGGARGGGNGSGLTKDGRDRVPRPVRTR
jgi:Ni/Fe-hydrogenase subunit HybB-like protein